MIDTAAIEAISAGEVTLGIELGSTRIKAVLIGPDHQPLATGGYDWENQFVDRIWTYSLDEVRVGLQSCFADVATRVRQRYGLELTTLGALGISGMMHGYLAFDAEGALLTPFRTWRNTITAQASAELSELFDHNIPQRWSIAHLLHAIRNGEQHVGRIAYLTTLAGYVHWQLTGEKVLGVGDASGMFPIELSSGGFNTTMIDQFDALVAAEDPGWRLAEILPTVLPAGQFAGRLTEAGAMLLDPSGSLQAGVPLCPPEGDAGTGMVATNSVSRRTGNVSAGTSIFTMVVLEHELARRHSELDLVTTPAGDLVAMVHCNNGASEVNSWAGLFLEFAQRLGSGAGSDEVFATLFGSALDADSDAGGLLVYNYLSGEHLTGLAEGRPLFVRTPQSSFTLANFMRAHLFAAFATMRIGMDILIEEEHAGLDSLFAHGGLFKTRGVAQRLLAAALGTPVSVGDIAGEGGAWGIALLARYAIAGADLSLDAYLNQQVFAGAALDTVEPVRADVAGFDEYLARFKAGLEIERSAVQHS